MTEIRNLLASIAIASLVISPAGVVIADTCDSADARQAAVSAADGQTARLNRNIRAAERAIANWRHGYATGDFKRFVDQLDDTVQGRLGLPAPFNVRLNGKSEVIAALTFVKQLRVRVIQTPVTAPMYSGYSATFEFVAKGTVGGNPVELPLLVVFDILDGRIVAFREYVVPS